MPVSSAGCGARPITVVLSGTVSVGSFLTVVVNGPLATPYTLTLYRDGIASGDVASSFVVVDADIGRVLTVRAHNAGHSYTSNALEYAGLVSISSAALLLNQARPAWRRLRRHSGRQRARGVVRQNPLAVRVERGQPLPRRAVHRLELHPRLAVRNTAGVYRLQCGFYDGASYKVIEAIITTHVTLGTAFLFEFWFDGVNLHLRIDGGAEVPVVAANPVFGARLLPMRVGSNWDGSLSFDGLICELAWFSAPLSATDRANASALLANTWSV